MHIVVAIDATTGDQPRAWNGCRRDWTESLISAVNGAGMLCCVVTVLAHIRCFFGQQAVVIGTVRVMACETVFLDGRVLPHEGSAFFGVAAGAEITYRFSGDHRLRKCTMRIMAIRARDLAFDDRVVRWLQQLRADLLVTRDTRFILQLTRCGFERCD